jgi:hypothetical protein
MVPPPAEGEDEVERDLKVLGAVFLRNGQRLRDCLRRGSILVEDSDIRRQLTKVFLVGCVFSECEA